MSSAEPTVTDQLVANAAPHRTHFAHADLPTAPQKHVTLVVCMDSRIDVFALFGLEIGEAHVIRNAGGIVTDDVIRSLVISQRKLGTREVVLVHHTRCGMQTFRDDDLKDELQAETGIRPAWSPESFTDVRENVRQSILRVTTNPFVPHRDRVRGFVYDVETGGLEEVV
ncbi:MAG: carbonic anhydrase [Mycobacterium sp.]|nr:carbonic anhydrase [Mycobacterium sp.]